MNLSDKIIKEYINKKELIITPYDEALVNPASLDIRLSNTFGHLIVKGEHLDPFDKESYYTDNFEVQDSYILGPGDCLIASTLEHITMPDNISALHVGKSSMARLFLDNSSFGGWIDPGFRGYITLEIVNHFNKPIRLTPGGKIGQLVFFKTTDVDTPYHKKPTSKYIDQKAGQGSLYHENNRDK